MQSYNLWTCLATVYNVVLTQDLDGQSADHV